jgi:hypothetical protein
MGLNKRRNSPVQSRPPRRDSGTPPYRGVQSPVAEGPWMKATSDTSCRLQVGNGDPKLHELRTTTATYWRNVGCRTELPGFNIGSTSAG